MKSVLWEDQTDNCSDKRKPLIYPSSFRPEFIGLVFSINAFIFFSSYLLLAVYFHIVYNISFLRFPFYIVFYPPLLTVRCEQICVMGSEMLRGRLGVFQCEVAVKCILGIQCLEQG